MIKIGFPICNFNVLFLCYLRTVYNFIIYQSSKFSFACVSLVENLSREIDENKLSPSHQRERETMHYSPVNNKKNHVRHHVNTRPLDRRKLRMFFELKLDLFYRIKFTVFYKINKIFRIFLYKVRFIFSFL